MEEPHIRDKRLVDELLDEHIQFVKDIDLLNCFIEGIASGGGHLQMIYDTTSQLRSTLRYFDQILLQISNQRMIRKWYRCEFTFKLINFPYTVHLKSIKQHHYYTLLKEYSKLWK